MDIPKASLKALLEICTKEAPFVTPNGLMYRQVDGVAMGSPLGVLFANFFMGRIERDVFMNGYKPSIYARYVDDCFVKADRQEEVEDLRRRLEEASGLRFTVEESVDNRLPFLDVLVSQRQEGFATEVYTKPTNPGLCLNGNSECPDRYRRSTIRAYVKRALTHCNSWVSTHKELERVTQVLVNNGYRNQEVADAISKCLNSWYETPEEPRPVEEVIRLYYRNHMSSQYKADEAAIKKIVSKCVIPNNNDARLQFIIFYKSMKTSNLILKNNPASQPPELQRSHLVYEYTCKQGNCEALPSSYIGMTTTKLSRRLTLHLNDGAPKKHTREVHGTSLTREMLVEGTTILQQEKNAQRLQILEALLIKDLRPTLNCQANELYVIPTSRTIDPRHQAHQATRGT